MSEAEEGTTRSRLEWWQQFAVPDNAHVGFRILRRLRAGKLALLCNMLVLSTATVDVLTSSTAMEAMLCFRVAVSVYSCGMSMYYFFHHHSDAVRLCFAGLTDAVALVEAVADGEIRKRLSRFARRDILRYRCHLYYGIASGVMVVLARKRLGEPRCVFEAAHSLWGRSDGVDLATECCVLAVYSYCVASCATAGFTFFAYVIALQDVTAELHRAIGAMLETNPALPALVSIQSLVLRSYMVVDRKLSVAVFHIFVSPIMLPLISTVRAVLNGEMDSFTMTALPMLLLFVFPLCEAGQSIFAAKSGVTTQAYRGPWLEESAAHQRLRLGVMQAARGRGCVCRISVVAVLNRKTFEKGMHSWLSFLRVLTDIAH